MGNNKKHICTRIQLLLQEDYYASMIIPQKHGCRGCTEQHSQNFQPDWKTDLRCRFCWQHQRHHTT